MTAAESPVGMPFIIWTLQRTGGTNFTRSLVRRSNYEKSEDEPFNKPRQFGSITKGWLSGGDRIRMNESISDILVRKICIKHCVEQVPLAISEVLAECAVRENYKHLFLYRKEPLGRLLSLEYAKRTGGWGVRRVQRIPDDSHAFREPLDVEESVRHEVECVGRMQYIWGYLEELGGEKCAVAFEDIYGESDHRGEQVITGVLEFLGLAKGARSNQKFVNLVRGVGDQRTRAKYRRFRGVNELERALESVPVFDTNQNL